MSTHTHVFFSNESINRSAMKKTTNAFLSINLSICLSVCLLSSITYPVVINQRIFNTDYCLHSRADKKTTVVFFQSHSHFQGKQICSEDSSLQLDPSTSSCDQLMFSPDVRDFLLLLFDFFFFLQIKYQFHWNELP